MPLPPYATLRASVGGGAVQTGGLVVAAGAAVVLSADPAGNLTAFLFEIYDYPVGFALPAGWSLDAAEVMYCSPTNGVAPYPCG